MLSIGKLGAGQHSYYLDKVAEGAEDYYSGEGEAEGYWLGSAADDLGLDGKAIQQFMGHSKIQTTFDVYGHLLPGSHDEVRKRMDAYAGRPQVATAREGWVGGAAILIGMPLISRIEICPGLESRRVDDEAAAIAAERIRSGAAE